MCLIIFAWNSHPDYSLVVAANRDEFYERPTSKLEWWNDAPDILAGRDQADVVGESGTWMGINRHGRFAALTNIRAPSEKNPLLRTRGELTTQFLKSNLSPCDFVSEKSKRFQKYNGFNLLIGEFSKRRHNLLRWASNRAEENGKIKNHQSISTQLISPGIYGLSNAMLDTPWPKIKHRIAAFSQTLAMDKGNLDNADKYLELLYHSTQANDEELPETGVSKEWEKILSSAFIKTDNYGTRATSVLRIRKDGVYQFTEQSFDKNGKTQLITKEDQLLLD